MTNGWQEVPLKEVAKPISRSVSVEAGTEYRTIGVKWWGMGAYERETIDGSRTAAKTLSIVREGDLIINKIWVRHGSVAIAGKDVDGCAGSGEFPTFELDLDRIEPRWIHWQTKMRSFWKKCDSLSRGTSGKNRIKPELFLTIQIPLPPLDEQRRIVEYVETLERNIEEVKSVKQKVETDLDRILLSSFHRIVDKADRKPMAEVAPLTRRPATINAAESYPQVSVRSFGRGTFHKPELNGSDITWQKPYLVKSGDILISNIKAWEGAIAVASESDDGRYGSHRYLTCVPIPNVATSRFVCFHLLTSEGLYEVGQASPGSADRNRTLSAKALMQIPIPVPPIEKQLWFDNLYAKVASLRELQSATGEELSALLPSVLDRAFKGDL